MPGTLTPMPFWAPLDDNGNTVPGGLIDTYAAGTSTPLATYTDQALSVAHPNPVVLDAAGRTTIFLQALSYKFVFSTAAAVLIRSQDNISAVPATIVEQDISGTAGETIAAGQGVYLSAGDGGRTAGRWYLWDADNTYSSITARALGMAPSAIASGASGSIRIGGRVTGLSGLTAGTVYLVSGTAGALTATPPTNARLVAVADSTTSVILEPSLRVPSATATQDGLLTFGAQTIGGVKTFNSTPIGASFYARCTSSLVKNANTTLADVTGLAFAIGIGETWTFDFVLKVGSATAADAKFALTGPAAPTAVMYGILASTPPLTANIADAFAGVITTGTGGIAQPDMVRISGEIRNGSTAGTVQLQAAQQTSDASNSTFYVESFVRAFRHA